MGKLVVIPLFFILISMLANPVFAVGLSLTVQMDKSAYVPNETIRIFGDVKDTNGQPVENATVQISIKDSNNYPINWSSIYTSSDGSFDYRFTLSSQATLGEYKTYVSVSKAGYENGGGVTYREIPFDVVSYVDPACSGNIQLLFSPTISFTSSQVSMNISGLYNCTPSLVKLRKISCLGPNAALCNYTCEETMLPNGSSSISCSCQFNAPSNPGMYEYRACIDRNNDGDYYEYGEWSIRNLYVQQAHPGVRCSGDIQLSLSKTMVTPSATVKANIDGLYDCDTSLVKFRKDSCSGTDVCNLECGASVLPNGTFPAGCWCEFSAPSSPGNYTYYACVDKNTDGDFSDSGESSSAALATSICEIPSGDEIPMRNKSAIFHVTEADTITVELEVTNFTFYDPYITRCYAVWAKKPDGTYVNLYASVCDPETWKQRADEMTWPPNCRCNLIPSGHVKHTAAFDLSAFGLTPFTGQIEVRISEYPHYCYWWTAKVTSGLPPCPYECCENEPVPYKYQDKPCPEYYVCDTEFHKCRLEMPPPNISVNVTKAEARIAIPNITIEKTADVTIETTEDLAIKEISIAVKNPVNNIRIRIKKLEQKPADVTVNLTGKVYHYIEIEKTNIRDEDINKTTIKFSVDKLWIRENKVNESTITLNRWNGISNTWQKLPTRKIDEDQETIYFESETSKLSIFAITAMAPITEAQPSECPLCPLPTEWSACVDNKQTRTNYRCSAETNYQCQAYTETKSCEVPTAPPKLSLYMLIPLIALIILAVIIAQTIKYRKKTYSPTEPI
jgi:PGF-pre-PGF domain-containing protein